jgi:hypothetical protein
MSMTRIVVRMPPDERDALDRLRDRYYDTTRRRISRAALVRVMVRMGLVGADARDSPESLPEAHVTQAALQTGLKRRAGAA